MLQISVRCWDEAFHDWQDFASHNNIKRIGNTDEYVIAPYQLMSMIIKFDVMIRHHSEGDTLHISKSGRGFNQR
jgi:hypothetical protein